MLNLEEPIFCHPNGRPIGSFKKGFEQVLNEAGVLRGSDGKKQVPYSLRHTYATMRISEGVSVFQLAANMGTSVEMIESFYGKKRMRDPKMATEVTKFRSRRCVRRREMIPGLEPIASITRKRMEGSTTT